MTAESARRNLLKDIHWIFTLQKEVTAMKKFVLLLAAAVITCTIGHQISGGYKAPEKERRKQHSVLKIFSR